MPHRRQPAPAYCTDHHPPNSCEATYRRMVSLCKRAVDMSDQTLMDYVTEAYPIVVFCNSSKNKQRHDGDSGMRNPARWHKALARCSSMSSPRTAWRTVSLSSKGTMSRSMPSRTASPNDCWKTGMPQAVIEPAERRRKAHDNGTFNRLYRNDSRLFILLGLTPDRVHHGGVRKAHRQAQVLRDEVGEFTRRKKQSYLRRK